MLFSLFLRGLKIFENEKFSSASKLLKLTWGSIFGGESGFWT